MQKITHMQDYMDLLRTLYYAAKHPRSDRTGVGRHSKFGHILRFNLQDGFPLFGGRLISLKAIAAENIWFLSGSCNSRDLEGYGARIWSQWGLQQAVGYRDNHLKGYLGPIYGAQWRFWQKWNSDEGRVEYIDQIENLLKNLVEIPFSSRHVVTAWNPSFVPNERLSNKDNILDGKAVLPACHKDFQCFIEEVSPEVWSNIPEHAKYGNLHRRILNLKVDIRSSDVPVGLPFNIAGYAFLMHVFANICGYAVGELVVTIGDAHIYDNQLEHVNILLDNSAEISELPLPIFNITGKLSLDTITEFNGDYFTKFLEGYKYHLELPIPVAT